MKLASKSERPSACTKINIAECRFLLLSLETQEKNGEGIGK